MGKARTPKTPEDSSRDNYAPREKMRKIARQCVGCLKRFENGYYTIETNHEAKHLRIMYLRPQDLAAAAPLTLGQFVELRYSTTPGALAGNWRAVG